MSCANPGIIRNGSVNSVSIAITGVIITPASVSIAVGGTQQLTNTIAPANATNQNVSYTSSNTNVAKVNATGLVTAVAAGTATITVTTIDGSKTAACAITVTAAFTNIALNIYPNPIQNLNFTITIPDSRQNTFIRIFDLKGKIVF